MSVKHLSYSSVDTYMRCPRSWKRKYMEHADMPVHVNLIFGSVFHSVVEDDIRSRCLGTGMLDLQWLWNKHWKDKVAESGTIDWGKLSPSDYYNDGLRMLGNKDVMATIRSMNAFMVHPLIYGEVSQPMPSVELEFSLLLNGIKVPIIGFIDVIGTDGVPVDIKTASKSWPAGKGEQEIQPAIYLAALNQCGYVQHGGRFRYVVFIKTKVPKVQVIDLQYTPAQIEWAVGAVRDVWKGIKRGVFPPNYTGWMCSPNQCGYWDTCRG